MKVWIPTPEELPKIKGIPEKWQKEKVIIKKQEKISNLLTKETEEEKDKGIPDIAIDFIIDPQPKVSLSWKEDVKSVIKWIKEHMDTYPETRSGFLVDFIDDSWEKWYEVTPNYVDKWRIVAKVKINWKEYKILKHTFSKSEHKMYKKIENWDNPQKNENWDEPKKYNKEIIEILKKKNNNRKK